MDKLYCLMSLDERMSSMDTSMDEIGILSFNKCVIFSLTVPVGRIVLKASYNKT